MKKGLFVSFLFLFSIHIAAAELPTPQYYGAGLCDAEGFHCIKIKHGQSWKTLFADERERDLVQRLNRSDTYLTPGKMLAVPNDIQKTTLFDISPFPLTIQTAHEKLIIIDQERLAWGAYSKKGELEKWGPISSGKDYCPDIHRSCRSITGIFHVFIKKDKACRSNIFPVGRGGSVMPYCMFFYKGYALHGSDEVYGYRASHGCIRLFTNDAKWLNEHFVEPPKEEDELGTKVVVQQLVTMNDKSN